MSIGGHTHGFISWHLNGLFVVSGMIAQLSYTVLMKALFVLHWLLSHWPSTRIKAPVIVGGDNLRPQILKGRIQWVHHLIIVHHTE